MRHGKCRQVAALLAVLMGCIVVSFILRTSHGHGRPYGIDLDLFITIGTMASLPAMTRLGVDTFLHARVAGHDH